MPLPVPGDLQWADPLNGYLSDLQSEADVTSADLGNHLVAEDPHGSLAPASANVVTQVAAHSAANDPHGDRANTANQILAHSQQQDVHGDRANATAKVNAHISANDPHGDRAFVNALLVPSSINGTGLGPVSSAVTTGGSVSSSSDWQENSGDTNCFVQLQVPSSGKLLVEFGFAGRNSNTSGSYIRCAPYLSYIVNTGGGSPGDHDVPPTGDNAIYAAPDGITTVWRKILFTGLVPGPVQIELWFDTSSGDATTSKFQDQWIIATPIPV